MRTYIVYYAENGKIKTREFTNFVEAKGFCEQVNGILKEEIWR